MYNQFKILAKLYPEQTEEYNPSCEILLRVRNAGTDGTLPRFLTVTDLLLVSVNWGMSRLSPGSCPQVPWDGFKRGEIVEGPLVAEDTGLQTIPPYVSSWYFRSRCTKAGRVPSSTVMLSVLVFGFSSEPLV